MSIKAMVHYLDRGGLKGNDKLCMVILADYSNDEGECFPGHARIAHRLGMTESGARKVLYRLRDNDELNILNEKGVITQTGPTNRYQLISYMKSEGVPVRTGKGKGVLTGTPRVSRGGYQGCPDGDTDPSVEPSGNHKIEKSDVSGDSQPVAETRIKQARADLHPAVEAYREIFSRHMRKDQRGLVEHITDIPLWKEAVKYVCSKGTNPNNIGYMLDVYNTPSEFGISQSDNPVVIDEQLALSLLGDDYGHQLSTQRKR